MLSHILLVYFAFSFIPVSALEIYGLGSCPSTQQVPRDFFDTPVSKLFYSFKLDTPSNQGISIVGDNVRIPMNQIFRGWYYRDNIAQRRHDSGIIEQFWNALPGSYFPDNNMIATENLMAVEQEGHWTEEEMQQTIQEAEEVMKDVENYNVEEDNDYLRRQMVLTWTYGSQLFPQIVNSVTDPEQIEAVKSNPANPPDFTPYRAQLASAVREFQSVDDYPYRKTASSCFHIKSSEINIADGYFTMPLGQQVVGYKASVDVESFDTIASKTFWNYNEEENTLEIVVEAFAESYIPSFDDGSIFQSSVSPPHMASDGRLQTIDNPAIAEAAQAQYCPYINQFRQIPVDKIWNWLPLDVVCPESLLERFREQYASFYAPYRQKTIESLDSGAVTTYETGVLLAFQFYTEFLPCTSKFLQFGVPYSHGFDISSAGVYYHFLLEFENPIDLLVDPELQSFDVGYKYGERSEYQYF